ncbi:MAG: serine/threonine-protein kinase [Planctomycetota bacterium]
MPPNSSSRDNPESFPTIPGFRFESILGRGSMAVVYRAVQLGMNRPVAVKVLRRGLCSDEKSVERLLREARLAARFNHPNVIRIIDAARHEGICYLVMDCHEGRTLKQILEIDGPLSEDEARRIAITIAEVLGAIDREGVVHRDVKPGNIIIDADGRILLGDFGLATIPVDTRYHTKTRTVGTPAYMSPEQASDPEKIDIRSDLFSLGATLYHAVTGESAFEARTVAEVITKILYVNPKPLRLMNPEISADFAGIIEELVQKRPQDRIQSSAELLRALGSEPVEEVRSFSRMAWAGAALVTLIGTIGLVLWQQASDPEESLNDSTTVLAKAAVLDLDRASASDLLAWLGENKNDFELRRSVELELARRVDAAIAAELEKSDERANARDFKGAQRQLGDRRRHDFALALGFRWVELPKEIQLEFEERRLDAGRRLHARYRSFVLDHRESAEFKIGASLATLSLAQSLASLDELEVRLGGIGEGEQSSLDADDRAAFAAMRRGVVKAHRQQASVRVRANLEACESQVKARSFRSAAKGLQRLRAVGLEARDSELAQGLRALEQFLTTSKNEVRVRLQRSLRSFDKRSLAALTPTPASTQSTEDLIAELSQQPEELEELQTDLARLVQVQKAQGRVSHWQSDLKQKLSAMPEGRVFHLRLQSGRELSGLVFVGFLSSGSDEIRLRDPKEGRVESFPIADIVLESRIALLAVDLSLPENQPALALAAYGDRDFLSASGYLEKLDAADSFRRWLEPLNKVAMRDLAGVHSDADREQLAQWRLASSLIARGKWAKGRAHLVELSKASGIEGSWAERQKSDVLAMLVRANQVAAILAFFAPRAAEVEISDQLRARVLWRVDPKNGVEGLQLSPFVVAEPNGKAFRVGAQKGHIIPSEIEPFRLTFPIAPNHGPFELRFRYVASAERGEEPRWLGVSVFGQHLLLLSRLQRRDHRLDLAWHGLERDLELLISVGKLASWRGELSNWRLAFRGLSADAATAPLTAGQAFDFRVVLDFKARRLRVFCDRKLLLEEGLGPWKPQSDLVEIRAPRAHRLMNIEAEGAIRPQD